MGSLDALKSASSTTEDALKAPCPNEVALTPVGRLDAMQKRLNSMVQAIAIVRTPLENFYNSLDDEQRQRFNAIGEPNRRGLLAVWEHFVARAVSGSKSHTNRS